MRTKTVLALAALTAIAASPVACFFPDYTFNETGSGGSGATGNTGAEGPGPTTGGAGGTGGAGVGGNLGEICNNGIDDDDDDQIDCADGECTDFVCAPAVPEGWSGYLALFDGPTTGNAPGCPDAYPDDQYVGNRDIVAPAADCSACTCSAAANQTCALPPTGMSIGDGTCADGSFCATNPQMPFPLGPANNTCFTGSVFYGADATCGPNSVDCTMGTDPCNVSATVDGIPATGGTCTPGGGVPAKDAVSWATLGLACGNPPLTAAGCNGSQVCLPRGGGEFESGVCIMHDGEIGCPPGSFTQQHVFYEGSEDNRGCSDCACGAAADGTCPATLQLFSTDTCVAGSLIASFTTGGCADLIGNPEVHARKLGPPGPATGGTCAPSGGDATGDAQQTTPTTFCCTP